MGHEPRCLHWRCLAAKKQRAVERYQQHEQADRSGQTGNGQQTAPAIAEAISGNYRQQVTDFHIHHLFQSHKCNGYATPAQLQIR
jgi:hypothetical protein